MAVANVVIERIEAALRERGPMSLYELMAVLGLNSFGSTQWYVQKAERLGRVKTTRVGKRVVVHLPWQNPFNKAKIRDVIMCLKRWEGEPASKIYEYIARCLPQT
ncbi:MAG: hypothetical protein QW680_11925 [Pyrobaculum sp.]|jgi:hypothetical protein